MGSVNNQRHYSVNHTLFLRRHQAKHHLLIISIRYLFVGKMDQWICEDNDDAMVTVKFWSFNI